MAKWLDDLQLRGQADSNGFHINLNGTVSLIENVETTVEEACASESNIFGYGIWSHHITQVAENARTLASRFDADEEIVVLGALLHDYASIKDEEFYEEHHIHGPREAEQLLEQHEYPQERIEQVKQCIADHRGSVDNEPDTREGICLASADGMAHIQQPHSLLYLAYVQHGMEIDEGAEWVRTKLERSWQKIDQPFGRWLLTSMKLPTHFSITTYPAETLLNYGHPAAAQAG